MAGIRMVDLKGQYEKIKEEVDAGIAGVINSTAFINGPAVKDFQDELAAYLGCSHVIGCANGTDALQVAMMALDLKPGDEVITTSFTFIATVEVIALLGLKPVLVDIDPDSFLMDPAEVRKAITPKTRVILPVHLFGQTADMDELLAISREHNLYVIEDACQSIGSDHIGSDGMRRKSGTMGHIGCTSFFPSKNLGCYGDGGALFTNDDALAALIRQVVNHGMEKRYYHDMVGVNSRLDSIQAAILKVKLKHLDDYSRARGMAADHYDRVFSELPLVDIPVRVPFSRHVFHQYTLKLANEQLRDGLKAHLESKQVPAMIYYPVPIHLQAAYANLGYKEGDLPVTEDLSHRVLSLPMHTELNEEQLAFITDSVVEYFEETE